MKEILKCYSLSSRWLSCSEYLAKCPSQKSLLVDQHRFFLFSFCWFTKFTCFRSSCRASSLKLSHMDYKMPLPGLS